ncbi:multidrug resistance-associated protein 4-like [Sitophilus oryzae]|uniref:Multidrug resistance-associated protein 4-like n=1 Tax=Sitophilus oryzae TaxID=7048 RepID=A0A6J2XW07_SITOR|nr:multidrug resistance-associated protein 4-like [Sitophilus oryzae]
MDGSIKKTRKPNPREDAFPLSAATFCYTIPTFVNGFKHDLEENDLTETLSEHKSSQLGNVMEKYWKEEECRALKKNSKPSLLRVLFKVFKWEFLFYGFVLFLSEAIRINQPIFLGNLVSYFSPPEINSTTDQFRGRNNSVNESNNSISQPIFLGQLLQFYSPTDVDITQVQAYWYAAGIVVCSLVNVLISHPYMMGILHFSGKSVVKRCK